MKSLFLVIILATAIGSLATVTYQSVCSGDGLPPGSVVAGDAGSLWSPSTSTQYLCIPEGTQLFGRMTDPSDPTVPFPGYCFYFNGTTDPKQRASSTRCSQIVVSTTPISWVTVSTGFPVEANMIQTGSQIAGRTAPSSTNYGNTVPGAVQMINGTLGGLVADDYGFTYTDTYEVAMTTPPTNGPIPGATVTGVPVRVVIAVSTVEAFDIALANTTNLTNFQYGRASAWERLPSAQGTIAVYRSVQGKRADLLMSVSLPVDGTQANTLVLSSMPNGTLSLTTVLGDKNAQPPSQNGQIRLLNFVANTAPLGLLCNGQPLIPNNITSQSAYYTLCGVAPTLAVLAGGAPLVNVPSVPGAAMLYSIYAIGDARTTYPPVQAFLLVDRPLV